MAILFPMHITLSQSLLEITIYRYRSAINYFFILNCVKKAQISDHFVKKTNLYLVNIQQLAKTFIKFYCIVNGVAKR